MALPLYSGGSAYRGGPYGSYLIARAIAQWIDATRLHPLTMLPANLALLYLLYLLYAAQSESRVGPSAAPAPLQGAGAAAAERAPEDAFAWTAGLGAEAAVQVMVAAMTADGVIEPEERGYLVDFARGRGVEPAAVGRLLRAAEEGRLSLPVPRSREESCAFLRGLVIMSLVDGRVPPGERRAIDACAASLDLGPADVDDLIAREKAAS